MTVPPQRKLMRKLLIGTAIAVVPALIAGFVLWPRSPLDLGEPGNLAAAGVLKHWAAGDVIVLVRHAERCDRSDATCMNAADGITHDGHEMATHIGDGFRTLGMANADVISSPATRTAQTGQGMFGAVSQSQEWLRVCNRKTLLQDVLAHKQAHRNLVLVTHSDCISKLEAQLDFEHAEASDYGTAFFVAVDAHDQASSLGVMNADGWAVALKR